MWERAKTAWGNRSTQAKWITGLIYFFILVVGGLELYGIASGEKGDTITEGFRDILWILPEAFAFITLFTVCGLLLWAAVHFMKGRT